MKTKTIKFLRAKFCAGKAYDVDEIAAVPVRDAFYLINTGAAVEADEPKPKKVKRSPENRMDEPDEVRE